MNLRLNCTMKKKLLLLALALPAVSNATIVLDNFSSGPFLHTSSVNAYTSQTGLTAITPTRYVAHTFVANPDLRNMRTEASTGAASFSTGVNVDGKFNVNYMLSLKTGVPASGTGLLTLADFNPANIDLSSESAFRLDYVNNDQPNTMLYVYGWDTTFSSFNSSAGVAIAPGSGSVVIPFSSFMTTISPNSLGMIGFGVLAPTSNDVTITQFSAVPEPASMIALSAGLLALARRRRK